MDYWKLLSSLCCFVRSGVWVFARTPRIQRPLCRWIGVLDGNNNDGHRFIFRSVCSHMWLVGQKTLKSKVNAGNCVETCKQNGWETSRSIANGISVLRTSRLSSAKYNETKCVSSRRLHTIKSQNYTSRHINNLVYVYELVYSHGTVPAAKTFNFVWMMYINVGRVKLEKNKNKNSCFKAIFRV